MANQRDAQTGELVTPWRTYTLRDVCVICGVESDAVVTMVSFGVIAPASGQPPEWRFSEIALARSKKAVRLRRDLGLDWSGLALALDLLEEIERLRAQIGSR